VLTVIDDLGEVKRRVWDLSTVATNGTSNGGLIRRKSIGEETPETDYIIGACVALRLQDDD
jgi:hypothetical protein